MNYKTILVTGGAGFIGSTMCIQLKKFYPTMHVIALDNLLRRGSELNISRLKEHGVEFVHGDVRSREDLAFENIDLLIECSAEPSVMAGIASSPEYILYTNLLGAIHCFELARKCKADVIFLSTSRIYPVKKINAIVTKETETRFVLEEKQLIPGVSKKGIAEDFPLDGVRSLYGATKLSAELVLQEYVENYGIRGVMNRCGLIAGPWQMGKVDQGVIALWMVHHVFRRPLSYIGFGGEGKQVRDVLAVDDLFELLRIQMEDMDTFNGKVYNVGGGEKSSVSLQELTHYCQLITKQIVPIEHIQKNRQSDIKLYLTDNTKISLDANWSPKKDKETLLAEIYEWISNNKEKLTPIFA